MQSNISHLIISIYKTIHDPESPNRNNEVVSVFNILQHNPNILNDRQLLLTCTAFVVTGLIPYFFNRGQPPNTPDAVFLQWLPGRWVFGFINPMLFFYFNPAIGEHFKRDFWDNWAPGWLDKYNPNLISLVTSFDQESSSSGPGRLSTIKEEEF